MLLIINYTISFSGLKTKDIYKDSASRSPVVNLLLIHTHTYSCIPELRVSYNNS